MKTTRLTNRQAREAVELAFDQDICMTTREEEMAAEAAEIDALIDEVDRELVAEARTAGSRVLRPFVDVERARRAQRRAVRDALSLVEANAVLAGLNGQAKSAGIRALVPRLAEGEAA